MTTHARVLSPLIIPALLVSCTAAPSSEASAPASEPATPAASEPAAAPAEQTADEHHYFHRTEQPHRAAWGYEASNGPSRWADLDPSYALARDGQAQSPIDLDSSAASDGVPFGVHYVESKINLVYNGHTVEEKEDRGSYLTMDGTRYELAQFHFHSPSEHTVDGKHAAMEMHLVHKSEANEVAVLAVLVEPGAEDNAAFAQVWDYLPSAEAPTRTSDVTVNPASMLPMTSRAAYEYRGSFTTPPCTEGVQWVVLKEPARLSQGQIDQFRGVIEGNNRPPQPLNDRRLRVVP